MRRCVPLLTLLSLAFAPAPVYREKPDARDARIDLEKMEGSWVIDRSERGGVRKAVTREVEWLIEGDRLYTSIGGHVGDSSFIVLDTRTTPRSIELWEKPVEAKRSSGIYRLDGDMLTVRLGQKRQHAVSGFGSSDAVWFFKRKKPS